MREILLVIYQVLGELYLSNALYVLYYLISLHIANKKR